MNGVRIDRTERVSRTWARRRSVEGRETKEEPTRDFIVRGHDPKARSTENKVNTNSQTAHTEQYYSEASERSPEKLEFVIQTSSSYV